MIPTPDDAPRRREPAIVTAGTDEAAALRHKLIDLGYSRPMRRFVQPSFLFSEAVCRCSWSLQDAL